MSTGAPAAGGIVLRVVENSPRTALWPRSSAVGAPPITPPTERPAARARTSAACPAYPPKGEVERHAPGIGNLLLNEHVVDEPLGRGLASAGPVLRYTKLQEDICCAREGLQREL